MPEEYIMSSKACVYVLGGSANNSSLFDFDGVYILDGGFAEKATGFVAHVRNVSGVLLSAPTKSNLGTVTALLEQNESVPVYTNANPLKAAKSGSSGEQVKQIQEANSKLLAVETPLFSPKYQPYIIYQSAAKGILSLYVLAGDAKDGEAITKALASGNEAEVERAAAEHGTIGVLLWRPTQGNTPAIRVLISGTSSMARIQQSLDKAAKHLPFLNTAVVKSKDALTNIPAPSSGANRPVPAGASKPLSRPTPPSSGTRPAAASARAPLRAAPAAAPPSRPATAKPTTTSRPAPAAKTAPPAARARPAAPTTSGSSSAARKPAPPARAAPTSSRSSAETVAQKKTVGKVQSAAPSKPAPAASAAKKAPVGKTAAAPTKKPSPPPSVTAAPVPPVVVIAPEAHLDDSVISLSDMNQRNSLEPVDIVLIPPTPEPPRVEEQIEEPKVPVEDVEPEIPPPVDAFKKPEPIPATPEEKPQEPEPTPVAPAAPAAPEDEKSHEPEPGSPEASSEQEKPDPADPETPKVEDVTPVAPVIDDKPAPVYPSLDDITPAAPSLIDFDPIPAHPEPSAPVVPADHVIISTDDPALPDIAAAVPFVPHVPGANDGLISLDDDKEHVAPGFEEPLIPQAPREDGTLADCSEEVSKLVEISMDTDKSTGEADIVKPIGEVTQLASDLQNLGLNDETNEYVRKISNQMIEDATLPFTSALASSIVGGDITAPSNGANGSAGTTLVDFDSNGHNGSTAQHTEEPKEASKHDLMQSRSSVIENGAPVQYEKTDPVIDDILATCANESEKLDAAHSDTLHMPERPGVPIPKSIKFARPYYFDVVTVPHNENQELTVDADSIREFVSKIRSRNVILPSKDISGEQLSAIITGKQTWVESAHTCAIVPTHSSPTLVDFRTKNEAQFPTNFLQFVVPVDKQRTTVSSPAAGAVEYELATLPLRE